MEMILIGLVLLALVFGVFYAGLKIILIPFRIALFVLMFIFTIIKSVLSGLFSPLSKSND